MLDTRKKLLILGGVTIVLLIALFVGVLFLRDGGNGEPTPPTPPPGASVEPPAVTPTPNIPSGGNSTQTTAPKMSPSDRYLIQLSKIFVERFGSHSSQNDNTHITDVLPLVTEGMVRWLKTQGQTQDAEYAGMTTRVVTATLQSNTGGKAVVTIEVQRILRGTVEKREYQKGRVELVEESPNEWKVNGLYFDKN